MSSIDDATLVKKAVISATDKALERAGPHFKSLLVFYLKDRYDAELEVVYDKPLTFHAAITDLFGLYSSTLLESIIKDFILRDRNFHAASIDFQSFIERIKNGEIKIPSKNDTPADDTR